MVVVSVPPYPLSHWRLEQLLCMSLDAEEGRLVHVYEQHVQNYE
jgi:hypothetical protein